MSVTLSPIPSATADPICRRSDPLSTRITVSAERTGSKYPLRDAVFDLGGGYPDETQAVLELGIGLPSPFWDLYVMLLGWQGGKRLNVPPPPAPPSPAPSLMAYRSVRDDGWHGFFRGRERLAADRHTDAQSRSGKVVDSVWSDQDRERGPSGQQVDVIDRSFDSADTLFDVDRCDNEQPSFDHEDHYDVHRRIDEGRILDGASADPDQRSDDSGEVDRIHDADMQGRCDGDRCDTDWHLDVSDRSVSSGANDIGDCAGLSSGGGPFDNANDLGRSLFSSHNFRPFIPPPARRMLPELTCLGLPVESAPFPSATADSSPAAQASTGVRPPSPLAAAPLQPHLSLAPLANDAQMVPAGLQVALDPAGDPGPPPSEFGAVWAISKRTPPKEKRIKCKRKLKNAQAQCEELLKSQFNVPNAVVDVYLVAGSGLTGVRPPPRLIFRRC